MSLRCGVCNDYFVANSVVILAVKELWKTYISQSYRHEYGVFFDSQCISIQKQLPVDKVIFFLVFSMLMCKCGYLVARCWINIETLNWRYSNKKQCQYLCTHRWMKMLHMALQR